MPPTRPRNLAALALLVAAALTTSGCAAGSPGAATARPAADAATAGLPTESPTASPAASPAAERPPAPPAFGETFRYGGGLVVTVAAPERFRPSAWVQREPGTPVRFAITVRNRTGDVWNPSRLHARVLSGFVPAVPIFDHDHQVVARPEERLADGAAATFSVGFWVGDAEQLTLELAPGFGYQPITVGRD